MSDIATFSRWKDWLLITLFGLVLTLVGLVAAENRQRLDRLEIETVEARRIRQNGLERLRAVEQSIGDGVLSRDDARDMENRLQRQIDSLNDRIGELRRRDRSYIKPPDDADQSKSRLAVSSGERLPCP